MGSLNGRHLYRWLCCCVGFSSLTQKPTTQVYLYRLKEGNIRFNIVPRGYKLLIGTKDHWRVRLDKSNEVTAVEIPFDSV